MVVTAIESGERDFPAYVEVDKKSLKGKYLFVPKLEEVPYPVKMEPNVIVELYSR
jgi:small subunit ribosomal protein S4